MGVRSADPDTRTARTSTLTSTYFPQEENHMGLVSGLVGIVGDLLHLLLGGL